jgi:hypothetical protein
VVDIGKVEYSTAAPAVMGLMERAMSWRRLMLILRPYFDRLVGMLVGFFGERVGELFLKAASCSGVAEFGCRGRGDWIDQPIACSASQPRCGATFSSPSCAAIQLATLLLVHSPASGGGVADP